MVKLVVNKGSGIFSLFMDLVICNILNTDDEYFIEIGKGSLSKDSGGFDHVFDQKLIEPFTIKYCSFKHGFRQEGVSLGAIETSNLLPEVKRQIAKFKIKNEIYERANRLPLNNALGVHIRIMDMNRWHWPLGVFTFDDYLRKIQQLEKDYDDIFIASDNYESIEKLKKIYGSRIKYTDALRGGDEQDDTYEIQKANADNPVFWMESFIDMLLLSRCKHLICRVSNLANAAIAYSDGIKVTRL